MAFKSTEEEREYQKNYRKEKKAEISAKRKEYREKNKDIINTKVKQWRLDNPEKASASSKAWRLANKDRLDAYNKTTERRAKQNASKKEGLTRLSLTNKKISVRTLNAWAIQVKRIQPKCMTCNSTEDLHAHHILAKAEYPQYALSLLNGITLCKYCHYSVHHEPSIDKTNITEV